MKTTMKRTFNLILTLALWLVAQTAWATDETKVFTISHAVGDPNNDYCGTITYDDYDFLIPDGNIMQNQRYDDRITMRSKMTGDEGTVKLYPRISGKVRSLTFSSARVMFGAPVGTVHYVKIGKGDIWTDSYTESMNTATTLTFTFTNDDGLQLANEDEYIEIKMRNNSESSRNAGLQISGTLTITYEPTASTLTHTHNFSYNAVGNTLTATCANDDGKECNLASSSYQISTSLTPPQNLIYTDGWNYPASMSGFENFRSETKATIGSITYIKTDTNEDYGTSEPNATGTYTASVTITAGGTGYTLQTSYRVTDYHFVYNNYPQFTITTDKSGNYAGNGQTVTITFTPKFGETLTGLTVTGATTNYSIGSGIADNGSNTYTFIMPGEDVTIGATFSISEDDFAETGTNEYTIKTANGWGWFCFAVNNDLAPDGFSGKVVKLAGNVSSSEMAGKSGHPFKGTFDGQNFTLTFNRTAAENLSAPFHYINGATISNLHVEGTITGGTYESLGGLVGHSEGNITINDCHVSTEISTIVSGSALHGGVIAQWNGTNATCTVTGCVYDGLIYNPNEAGVTTSCRGFIGWDYGNSGKITFTDCLSAPAAYGTDKYALGDNCFAFVYPNSEPTLTYNMTNCYYTSILGNRQGRPAATVTVAPANLGNATTDHGMVDGYKNGFLYNGKYYTPKYGDAVVEYRFNDWIERADVTINGTNNQETGVNVVGVNITEEVGNIKSVTYNRPFTAAQASTVILPFNYTCNGNEGGSFYSFAGINGTTPVMADGNHVTSLTANTPYLFVPTATAMTFPNISNMTGGVVTLVSTAGEHKATSGDWKLVGSYEPKTWATNEIENIYRLDGTLVHMESGALTKPTDAYFQWIGSGESGLDDLTLTATAATVLGEEKYVTTFFNSALNYQLPEGALAYTAGLDGTQVVFYRIGENSDVIPAGTAVIIVADAASITLTKTTDPGITIASAKNILTGADLPTAVSEGKVEGKMPYVLGISGGTLGLYKYTGDQIPAGKAFYLATE